MMYYDDDEGDPPEVREYNKYVREELARMNGIMDMITTKAKTLISEHYGQQLKTLSGNGFRQLDNVMSRALWNLTRDVSLIIENDQWRDKDGLAEPPGN